MGQHRAARQLLREAPGEGTPDGRKASSAWQRRHKPCERVPAVAPRQPAQPFAVQPASLASEHRRDAPVAGGRAPSASTAGQKQVVRQAEPPGLGDPLEGA